MKIRITLKDPDGVYECVKDAVEAELRRVKPTVSGANYDRIVEANLEDTFLALNRWVEYQEYVTVEIDLEAGTAVVVPVK